MSPIKVIGDAVHLSGATARLLAEVGRQQGRVVFYGEAERYSIIVGGLACIVGVAAIMLMVSADIRFSWLNLLPPALVIVACLFARELFRVRARAADARITEIVSALGLQPPELWPDADEFIAVDTEAAMR